MVRIHPSMFASLILAPAIATAAPAERQDATLRFDAQASPLVGVSFGLDAVDSRRLIFDQRKSVQLGAGLRAIEYSCPGEMSVSRASVIRFEFEPGRDYELVCRAGQAQIRIAEDRC